MTIQKLKTILITLRALAFAIFVTFLPALIIAFFAADIDIALSFENFQSTPVFMVGLYFIIVGFIFRIWATLTFYNHHLAVLRLSAQNKLITSGPYRFTRSPHYIGFTLIFLGCAILVGSYVALVAVVLLFAIWNLLLKYEEPRLVRAFGERYEKYRSSVPRWIKSNTKSVWAWIGLLIITPFIIYGISLVTRPNIQEESGESKYTVIDDLTIHYKTYGDNTKPPLLFVGGLPMKFFSKEANESIDFKAWRNVFAQHFYLIIVDNPGFGESDPPPHFWSFSDYSDFFNEFLNQTGISDPTVMGKSWGGGIAASYAVNYPENTKALVLVNSGVNEDINRFEVRVGSATLKLFSKVLTSKTTPLSMKKYFISGLLNVPPEKIDRSTIERYSIMSSVILDFKPVNYGELKSPLILVWGKDDFWAPVENAYMLHENIPNSTLLLFDGKHLMMEKNPKEVIEKVVENLQELNLYP